MAKSTSFIYLVIFLINFSSIRTIDYKCNNNIFILISTKTIYLINFDIREDYSPAIIYEAQANTTIENGLFHKRTNTIILLVSQLDNAYQLISLNVHDDIYNYWKEKSNKITFSTYVSLSISQNYLYVLNNQTLLLQTYNLPLTTTVTKKNYLKNLPANQTIINYIIDEKFHSLWILIETKQTQLYICDLISYDCYFYMNINDLNKPLELHIDWKFQQFYIHSKEHLMIFDYNQNETSYSINYLDSTQRNQYQFITTCDRINDIEYVSINYSDKYQICYQTCQYLPLRFTNETHIHKIQRLSSSSDILYCSKQLRIGKVLVLILILIDLGVILAVIVWLAYKYCYNSISNEEKYQTNHETISTYEKDSVTHF